MAINGTWLIDDYTGCWLRRDDAVQDWRGLWTKEGNEDPEPVELRFEVPAAENLLPDPYRPIRPPNYIFTPLAYKFSEVW
ncbi:hypothetical protein FACS1894186_4860 [Alphaproteobacteria bacterium]|nr:hypothetical protein FACS1894186_4860 [Alphaproteobacteria bacterium]